MPDNFVSFLYVGWRFTAFISVLVDQFQFVALSNVTRRLDKNEQLLIVKRECLAITFLLLVAIIANFFSRNRKYEYRCKLYNIFYNNVTMQRSKVIRFAKCRLAGNELYSFSQHQLLMTLLSYGIINLRIATLIRTVKILCISF